MTASSGPLAAPLPPPTRGAPQTPPLSLGWLLLIVVVALVARSPGFSGAFVNYDDPEIRAEVAAKSPLDFFTGVTYFAYKPIYGLSLWLDHVLFRDSPLGGHVVNGLLFAAAAALCALLVYVVLRDAFLAVGAALLLAVHPVHTENVAWVAERKDALSLVFVLLAHLAWRRRRALAPERASLWAAVLLALGGLTKGTVWLWAGVVAVDEWIAPPVGGSRLRRLAPLVLVALAGIALDGWMGVTKGPGAVAHPATTLQLAAAAAGVHLRYLVSLFVPTGLSVDYAVDPAGSFADPFAIGGVALAIAAVGGLIVGLRRRRPLLAIACGLWVFGLAPVNDVWPTTSVLRADRYLLVPAVGLYLLVLAALARLPRARVAIVCGAVIALGVAAADRAKVFASSDALWTDAIEKQPASAVAWINRAYDATERRDWARADADGERGLAAALAMRRPELALRARLVRALALLQRAGQVREGARAFIDRSLAEAKAAVALADSFERTPWVKADPAAVRAQAHAAVGRALETRGRVGDEPALAQEDLAGALAAYRLAVAADPGSFEGWRSLGNLLSVSKSPERLSEAADALRKAQTLLPTDEGTIVQRVGVLYNLKRDAEARDVYNEAFARLGPTRTLVRFAADLAMQVGSDPDAADRKLYELWRSDRADTETRDRLHRLRKERARGLLAELRTAKSLDAKEQRARVDGVVAAFDRVLEIAPGDADAHMYAADALFQAADFAAARARYERAIAAAPASPWMRTLAARAGLLEALSLARAHQVEAAQAVIAKVVLLGPPRLDLGFATLDAEVPRLVDAAKALSDGTGVEPSIAGLVLLGAALLVGGAEEGTTDAPEDGAESALRRATSLIGGPMPAGSRLERLADTAVLLRAIVRGRRADVAGARSDLETIRSRHPDDPLVLHQLIELERVTANAHRRIAEAAQDDAGVAKARAEESEVLAAAERLAASNPPWPGPGLVAAEIRLARGEFIEALKVLSALSERFPADASPQRGIAAVYQAQMLQGGARTMLLEQAREALSRAKEIDPRDPRTALDMSQLYRLAGDLETAARNALQAASVEPIPGPAAKAFAAIRVEQGRKALESHELEKATAWAKEASEADKASAAPWLLDGDVALAMQDLARALRSFERAREVEPASVAASRALADCHRRRGGAYFAWKMRYPAPKAVKGVAPDPKAVEDWNRTNLKNLRQAILEFEASLRLEPSGIDADTSRERIEQLRRDDPERRKLDMTAAQEAFEAGEKARRADKAFDALERYREAVAARSEFLPAWMRIAEMSIALGSEHDVEGLRAIEMLRDLDPDRAYPEPDLYAGEIWSRRAKAKGPDAGDAARRARAALERFVAAVGGAGEKQAANLARARALLRELPGGR